MKKLSIIVPIYNQEKLLSRCIESIIKQTYSNLEIILVNDGSIDNSLNICKEYSKSDERIIIIDKKNTGISDARNVGLSKVTGDYITFVDSDDYIDIKMYDKLINNLEENNADISICDYAKEYNVEYNYDVTYKNNRIKIISSDECIQTILNESGYSCVCWNKIFKKELFENVSFNNKTKIGEDLEVLMTIIPNCNNIVYDSNKYCKHYINTNSITQDNFIKNIEKWNSEIYMCSTLMEKFKNTNKYIYAIKRYCRVNITCYLKTRNKDYRRNILTYFNKLIFSNKINLKFKLKLIYIKYFYWLKMN